MKHSEVFLINHIWKETQKVYFSWKQIKAQRKRLRKATKGLDKLRGKQYKALERNEKDYRLNYQKPVLLEDI